MLGIGKMLGNIAGGYLDQLGLGRMATFVKLGLNAMTGNWMEVAREIFGIVSNFKGDFLDKAAKQPPLGNFQTPRNINEESPLNSDRLTKLLRGMGEVFGGLSNINHSGLTDGLRRIFGALSLLQNTFNNHSYYDTRASSSMFLNMRM